MQSYLERYDTCVKYNQGYAKEVWAELLSFGPAIRDARLYPQAIAVARRIMSRARQNIKVLIPRLHALGYQFAQPDAIWVAPTPQLIATLDQIEHAYGPLPIVVRTWFEVIGVVNFMGAHPKLNRYDDGELDRVSAVHGDPLVVELFPAYDSQLSGYQATAYVANEDDDWRYALYEFPFAPDVSFKAVQSGSGPLCVLVPNPTFDAPILDPTAHWTGTFFLQHLQTCFAWGGFPGLQHLPDCEQPTTELGFLRKGLLPLL